jgi:hypothetical protein
VLTHLSRAAGTYATVSYGGTPTNGRVLLDFILHKDGDEYILRIQEVREILVHFRIKLSGALGAIDIGYDHEHKTQLDLDATVAIIGDSLKDASKKLAIAFRIVKRRPRTWRSKEAKNE